ncbi:lysostaphin resistance A-like protein [Chlamydiota bacterium]
MKEAEEKRDNNKLDILSEIENSIQKNQSFSLHTPLNEDEILSRNNESIPASNSLEEENVIQQTVQIPYTFNDFLFVLLLYTAIKITVVILGIHTRQLLEIYFGLPQFVLYVLKDLLPELIIVLVIVFISSKYDSGRSNNFLKFHTKKTATGCLYGGFFFVLFFPFIIILKLIQNYIKLQFDIPISRLSLQSIMTETTSLPSLFFYGIFYLIIIPFIIEIIFRGFFFQYLQKRFNLLIGIIGSSLIFAVLFFNRLTWIDTFALGSMLCFVFYKAETLTASFIFHFLYRLLPFCFLFYKLKIG